MRSLHLRGFVPARSGLPHLNEVIRIGLLLAVALLVASFSETGKADQKQEPWALGLSAARSLNGPQYAKAEGPQAATGNEPIGLGEEAPDEPPPTDEGTATPAMANVESNQTAESPIPAVVGEATAVSRAYPVQTAAPDKPKSEPQATPTPVKLYVVTHPKTTIRTLTSTQSPTPVKPQGSSAATPTIGSTPKTSLTPVGNASKVNSAQMQVTSRPIQSTTEPTKTALPRPPASGARVWTPQNPCGCPGLIPWDITARIGIYEVTPALGTATTVSLDHYYVSWDGGKSALHQNLLQSASRKHSPVVTIEPFAKTGLTSAALLTDIVAGKYDGNITDMCGEVAQSTGRVFVRWGHEMENVTGRYPWAVSNGSTYIAAYRYFVTHCRSIAANAQFVWSPAGNRELTSYWPGPDYVDYVGLSMYSYPAWERDFYGYVRTFEQAFGERYGYVQNYGKPVMIAELGATGAAQEDWLRKGLASLPRFPLVKAAIFFNAQDPAAWGSSYPAPDWRLPSWSMESVPPPWMTW